MTYNSTGHFWKIVVPRTCVSHLADKIKVNGEPVTTTSAQGASNSTRWLARG